MSNKKTEYSFYEVQTNTIGIDDFLESKFSIPEPFIEANSQDEVLFLPTFLTRNDEFIRLLDDSQKLKNKVKAYKGIRLSELKSFREEYRSKLEQVFNSINQLNEALASSFISHFKSEYENIQKQERKRRESWLYKIKSLFQRQLPTQEEMEKSSHFIDTVTTLSNYFDNVVRGMDIDKALNKIGYFPDKNFARKLARADKEVDLQEEFDKEYENISQNIPKERKVRAIVNLLNKYDELLRKTYQEELQNELRTGASSITNSKDTDLTFFRYDHFKRIQSRVYNLKFHRDKEQKSKLTEESILSSKILETQSYQDRFKQIKQQRRKVKEYSHKNILTQLEQLRKKAFPIAINYVAVQKAINKSSDRFSEIREFAKIFASKKDVTYSEEAIQTLLINYYSRDKTDSKAKVIEQSKDENKELKKRDPSRGTLDNWIKKCDEFRTDAQ